MGKVLIGAAALGALSIVCCIVAVGMIASLTVFS